MTSPQYPNQNPDYNSPPSGGYSGFPPPPPPGGYPPPPTDAYTGYPPPADPYASYPPPNAYPGYQQQPPNYPPSGAHPGYQQPPVDAYTGYPPPNAYPGYQQPPVDAYTGYPGAYPVPGAYPNQMYAPGMNGALGMMKGGFWIRLVAYMIDSAIISLVYFIAMLLAGIFLMGRSAARNSYYGTSYSSGDGVATLILLLLILAIPLLYLILVIHVLKGATPGKKIVGLQVVDVTGRIPSAATLWVRYTVGYFASHLILDIGFLMVGFDMYKQGLHDKLCGTYVVYKNQPGVPRYY